jgi:hypothetical protein
VNCAVEYARTTRLSLVSGQCKQCVSFDAGRAKFRLGPQDLSGLPLPRNYVSRILRTTPRPEQLANSSRNPDKVR